LTIDTIAKIAAYIESLELELSPAAVRELAANIHATRAAAGPEEKKIQAALDALN
jgi:cytochrome c553